MDCLVVVKVDGSWQGQSCQIIIYYINWKSGHHAGPALDFYQLACVYLLAGLRALFLVQLLAACHHVQSLRSIARLGRRSCCFKFQIRYHNHCHAELCNWYTETNYEFSKCLVTTRYPKWLICIACMHVHYLSFVVALPCTTRCLAMCHKQLILYSW